MKTERTTITDASIKRHAGDRDILQLSEPVSGLVFRYSRLSREKGSYYLRHYQGGKERWALVARYPEVPTKQARAIYREMKATLYATPEVSAVIDRFTHTKQLLEWYADRTARNQDIGTSRKEAITSNINKHLIPLIGDLLISDITRHRIDQELIQPLRDSQRPSYVRAILGVLRQATKQAAVFNLMTHDPLAGWSYKDFSTVKVQPRLPRLTQSELNKLIGQMPDYGRTRLLIQLMTLWGTRVGETLAMKWDWVDMETKAIRIPAAETKTGSAHTIPLTQQAIAILTEWKTRQTQKRAFLFPGQRGKSLDESQAHRELAKVSQGEWTAHDLRKLANTIWGDLGVEWMVCEKLLNHHVAGLDRVYSASQINSRKREALTMYHEHLEQSGFFI